MSTTLHQDNRWESEDKAALYGALLLLHTCPNCREDLAPYPIAADVWVCATCRESWHVPVNATFSYLNYQRVTA